MSASPATSRLLVRALRAGAPQVTRAVVGTLLDPRRRRMVGEALARLEGERGAAALLGGAPVRHPMAPAAVRIERTRSRGLRGEAEQMAVTMWFGDGPSLPAPGGGRFPRGAAARIGAGVVSAAAVAAASALVARMNERPAPRVVNAPEEAPRLPAPAERPGPHGS